MNSRSPRRQGGASLIEVLVSMVILSVGLLSLVVLHGRLHLMQVESYQRSQALILLNDMANRVALNRNDADSYVTGTPWGAGMTCPTDPPATRQEADAIEWCDALQGAAETLGGASVGAMVGGRGCVEDIGNGEYLITVAWQGLSPVSAPPDSVGCGAGAYDSPDTDAPCQDDLCRRAVTTVVRIATLT